MRIPTSRIPNRSFTNFVFIIIASVLSWVLPYRALACNLVPNGSFEQGTGSTFDHWEYKQWTGSGSLSVSTYPDELQSGTRAPIVTVTQAGALVIRTVPEQYAISVMPNTSYTLSARLLSFNGEKAGLWIVESSNGILVKGTFLDNGGGTGAWETLESAFTTQPSTTHMAIRLVHHITTGTFIWDDVSLWRIESNQRCVDMRHHIFQSTPGFKMCNGTSPSSTCVDGYKDSNSEFVLEYSNGIRDFYAHTGDGSSPQRVGVHKNLDSGNWRCFADPGELCGNGDGSNAQYPAHTTNLTAMLPVLHTIPSSTGVTPGAQLVHGWQRKDVRVLNWIDGSQGPLIGPIWNRVWSYVLADFDFGGDVGLQTNVLVTENEGTGVDPLGFDGGERLERYFFVRGYGRIKQSGREDADCRVNQDAISCDGEYDILTGSNTFNIKKARDFSFSMSTPWNLVDWW